MIIWAALIIPFIGCIILATLYKKNIEWWEYVLCLIIPILIIAVAKEMSVSSQTHDTEIFNNYVVSAEYYEDWDEYIHRTCTETYACGSDSKGNTIYCTRSYDCSYVDYHPEYWVCKDNSGMSHSIDRYTFEKFCKKFNNRSFHDMRRDYHSNDGDMYYCINKNNAIEPVTTQRTYENKVQCSKSVFNFNDPDTVKYKLFNYPKVTLFNYNPILGWKDDSASRFLAEKNAINGMKKKVHMMMLVFPNQPYEAAINQLYKWKGGNKNEFIMCVGINKADSSIKWTKVISWTDVQIIKVRSERLVKELGKFNAMKACSIVVNEVESGFVKKSFKDFNYITIEPTYEAIMATFMIVLLATIAWMIFAVRN